jgi:hypothetical protein
MKKKKEPSDFEIVELIVIRVDSDRKFTGSIWNFIDDDGTKFVTGKAYVADGYIWCSAKDRNELTRYMDGICRMKLDDCLHDRQAVSSDIFGENYFLN